MTDKCLFSAPFAFMPDILPEYQAVMPTVFREIWDKEELRPDPGLTAWVMNPGQNFTIDKEILDLFPSIKVLVTPSTGRNHIDLTACGKRNIPVYSLLDDRDGLNTISASAEFTFLLLLNTLRRLDLAMQEVDARRWRQREDLLRGHELSGKRVGLVGFGRIGHRLARYCTAFEADVVYYDPYVEVVSFPSSDLEGLFSQSDIVCVCCALTPETTGMIDRPLLERLKEGACLVNTSRGEVVNEQDLIDVLERRPDLRVGLDVITGEVKGMHLDSPLLDMHDRGQIVVTPHVAGATVESQTKAAKIALDLLRTYLRNQEDPVRS